MAKKSQPTPEVIDKIIKERIAIINEKGGGGNGSNWTDSEKNIRRTVILNYIRDGYSKKRTIEEIMDRWEVADCTAYNYYNDALNALADCNREEDISKIKNKQIERLEGVAQRALKCNNYQDAVKAFDLLNKINGLYTEQSKITVEGDIKFDFE